MPTTVIHPKGQVVECDDGLVVDGGGQTCADACNEECCVNKDNGEDACVGFTGSVSKDGKSSIGESACLNANISTVCYGCHGERACFEVGDNLAGGDKGSIGMIASSCNGIKACHYAVLDGGDIN